MKFLSSLSRAYGLSTNPTRFCHNFTEPASYTFGSRDSWLLRSAATRCTTLTRRPFRLQFGNLSYIIHLLRFCHLAWYLVTTNSVLPSVAGVFHGLKFQLASSDVILQKQSSTSQNAGESMKCLCTFPACANSQLLGSGCETRMENFEAL